MIISDFFNEPVEFFHDRRTEAGGYYFDALLSEDRYRTSPNHAGINRFCLDTLDDAVELQNAFLYLHRCYAGQISHILPCDDIQVSLNL